MDSLLSPMEDQICVTLQLGILKEHINLDRSLLDLAIIRSRARQFLEKHFPNQKIQWQEKMLLFRHNYESQNMLQLLHSADEINNGTVIEIVLSSKNERPDFPHTVSIHSYYSPTFCDYCGEILVGLTKQGLKCSRCSRNFHKKCAFAAHNNCAAATTRSNGASSMSSLASASQDSGMHSVTHQNGYGLPHTFVVHTYKKPTVCKVCNALLMGIIKQGLQCRDCKVNVHKKCANNIGSTCHSIDQPLHQTGSAESMDVDSAMSSLEIQPHLTGADAPLEGETGDLIPLGRIPGTAAGPRASKPRLPTSILEGWMLHFTNASMTRRRHYWRMDFRAIVLFQDETMTRYYKILNLSDILSAKQYDGPPKDPCGPPHCIELHTASVIYYVGENLEWYSKGNLPPQLPRRESGIGLVSANKWLTAIQAALLPPPSPALRQHRVGTENGQTTVLGGPDTALEFSGMYQICADDVLGTGQFGTVYSGVHRLTKREVAIKEIVKDRAMTKKWRDALRNEVAILQKLHYPGIITLEAMFEFSDLIYVVMEKMRADMLEMILSNKEGRLSERVTKFLVFQILKALKYLHEQDIAHCDLKPENVLLSSSETDFPQAKLCDFGYARIIGENSFRKTVVGTPAYLAPEVLQKRGYNKSLDMWSVGVVVYVTLSGTFPFNDGEDIVDQIENAAFMYPPNPWRQISTHATDLISKLLRVKPEQRLTTDQCIEHTWLKDSQLWADLRSLETVLGTKYLTTEAES